MARDGCDDGGDDCIGDRGRKSVGVPTSWSL